MINDKDSDINVFADIINRETGEVIDVIYLGDRVVHTSKLNKKEEYPTIFWQQDNFYKGYNDELKLLCKELNVYEKAILFTITPYISYDSCCIQHHDGTDIGTEEISEMMVGVGRMTTYNAIDSLVKKDILYKGKNSRGRQYYINPWLFSKGNRINKTLKSMFKNYKIRSLNNKKWSQIK